MYVYVLVITRPRGTCLIYMPKPKGRRPEGAGIYIRQITSGRVISDICHVTPHGTMECGRQNFGDLFYRKAYEVQM